MTQVLNKKQTKCLADFISNFEKLQIIGHFEKQVKIPEKINFSKNHKILARKGEYDLNTFRRGRVLARVQSARSILASSVRARSSSRNDQNQRRKYYRDKKFWKSKKEKKHDWSGLITIDILANQRENFEKKLFFLLFLSFFYIKIFSFNYLACFLNLTN